MEIEELEEELLLASKRKAQLEEEVSQYAIALRHSQDHILPIPVELLVTIFSIIISSDLKNIATLLSVCHSWRSIIVSAPVLWSTINITLPARLTDVPLWTYICRTCVDRSGESPLTITLDYSKVCETRQVFYSFPVNIQYATFRRLGMGMCAWMNRYLLPKLPNYRESFLSTYTAPLLTLIGSRGIVTARWYSFTLRGDHRPYTLSAILYHALSGRRLRDRRHVDKLSSIVCLFDAQQACPPDPTSRFIFARAPRAPILRHLAIPVPCSLEAFDPSVVLGLRKTWLQGRQLHQLGRYQSLLHLSLDISRLCRIEPEINLKEGEVFFPCLLTLEACPDLPRRFWELLDAPVLEVLRVLRSSRSYISSRTRPFPKLGRIEIASGRIDNNLDKDIRALVSASPLLRTLTCHKSLVPNVISSVKGSLGDEGMKLSIIIEESKACSHPLRREYVPMDTFTICDM